MVIQPVNMSISALTTSRNSPSVMMVSGRDSSWTIGLTTALTSVNTTATMSSAVMVGTFTSFSMAPAPGA